MASRSILPRDPRGWPLRSISPASAGTSSISSGFFYSRSSTSLDARHDLHPKERPRARRAYDPSRATLGAAYLDLGVMHTPAAMLIGFAKAVLIVLIFMRLRPSGPLVMLAFAAGVFWLLIMFTLTLGDYFTRS
jgi:caa(3)-type oxidase subunit IV